jgi:acyl-CoA synthetase (NDP forming)
MTDIVKRFEPLFEPKSIAFIGASANLFKWGFQIPFNVIAFGYDGAIYPVNPRETELLHTRVYKSVGEIPDGPVDLAVVTVPARAVLDVIKECAAAGVKAVVVVTAGFGELGEEGIRMEAEMARIAHGNGMLLVGPNCMGVVSPHPRSLYCEMPPIKPKPGTIAMASQSGNVGATTMRLAAEHRLGISRCVSTGNEAVLRIEDYIEYFGQDPRTNVITAYIEGVDDGRRFLDVARDVSSKKPVIVLKVGGTEAGERAAKSHTGALAGSRDVFRGACKQAGVIQVVDTEELFDVAAALAGQPLPRGNRIGVVTYGGGWGVLAADACAEFGLDVVRLPDDVLAELDSFLPSWWSRNNPVDLVAGLVERAYTRSIEILLKCAEIDGVMALGIGFGARRASIYRKQGEEHAAGLLPVELPYEEMADRVIEYEAGVVQEVLDLMDRYQKPLILAADSVTSAHYDQNEAIFALWDQGVQVYPTPRRAARAFARLAERHEYLASIGVR